MKNLLSVIVPAYDEETSGNVAQQQTESVETTL